MAGPAALYFNPATGTVNQVTGQTPTGTTTNFGGALGRVPNVSGGTETPFGATAVLGTNSTNTDPFGINATKAANQTNFLNQLPGAMTNISSNATDATSSANRTNEGTAASIFSTAKTGQNTINASRDNVELNRLNGVQDITDYVRNGLTSGANVIGNMGAGESSAEDALSRAYTTQGGQKARNVGNQAFIANHTIDANQQNLNDQTTSSVADLHRQRDEQIATIGSQARQQLAALDSQAVGLSLPDRIQVDQEKQKIIDSATNALSGVDSWLNGQLAGVTPEDQATISKNANALKLGGTAGTNPFDTNTNSTGLQVSGPDISQLPLFTRNKKVTG